MSSSNFTSRVEVTRETRWRGRAGGPGALARALRLAELLGEIDMAELSTGDVQRAAEALRAEGKSPATVNRYMAALSAVVSDARADGILVGPHRIPRALEPQGRYRYLQEHEVQELEENLEGRFASLLRFLYETGLRPSEAFRLEWDSVDAFKARATVWESKTGRARTVPLTQAACAALSARQSSEAGPWVSLTLRTFQRHLREARRGTSMSGDASVTAYAARHGCATRLAEAGVHTQAIAAWMGHSARTAARYIHSDQMLLSAVRAIEGAPTTETATAKDRTA